MRDPFANTRARAKPVHPFHWLWEPMENDPGFVLKSMFGAKAVYLDGKITLCFCASDEEPWQGVLVCTDRDRQPALCAEFPQLTPHPILPKWLYLPESTPSFETTARRLVRLTQGRDPRLGVIPKPRQRKRRNPIR